MALEVTAQVTVKTNVENATCGFEGGIGRGGWLDLSEEYPRSGLVSSIGFSEGTGRAIIEDGTGVRRGDMKVEQETRRELAIDSWKLDIYVN